MKTYLSDHMTLKWTNDGKRFCLHIQRDDEPLNCRRDQDNLTIMACFHRRYDLGDKLDTTDPDDFWRELVRKHLTEREITEQVMAGKVTGMRAERIKDDPEIVTVFEDYDNNGEWSAAYEEVGLETAAYYILDDLTIQNCMELLEDVATWLPLWLYDHSGITMSCGGRSYPYNDPWDSWQVGWIVCFKSTILENWPNCEDWQEKADEIMRLDVKEYDYLLTGEVYGYTLYEYDEDAEDWNEADDGSCWGFYGDTMEQTGIAGEVGNGLQEALEAGAVEEGEAEPCAWEF